MRAGGYDGARRALVIEGLLVVGGAVVTAVIVSACAWAYPPGGRTVWLIGYATIAAVVAMNVPQLRHAWLADRARNG